MRIRVALVVGLLSLFAVIAMGSDDCGGGGKQDAQRENSVAARASTFDRAEKAAPMPQSVNFPLRKALVEMTKRQDMIDHPWYVYILGDNGNQIGYYVAKTTPINACDFLGSTEDVYNSDNGNLVLTAPSLDGVFYGGGGASSGCDAWFFFDVSSDALITIRGVKFYVADAPLRLDAAPIKVGQ